MSGSEPIAPSHARGRIAAGADARILYEETTSRPPRSRVHGIHECALFACFSSSSVPVSTSVVGCSFVVDAQRDEWRHRYRPNVVPCLLMSCPLPLMSSRRAEWSLALCCTRAYEWGARACCRARQCAHKTSMSGPEDSSNFVKGATPDDGSTGGPSALTTCY